MVEEATAHSPSALLQLTNHKGSFNHLPCHCESQGRNSACHYSNLQVLPGSGAVLSWDTELEILEVCLDQLSYLSDGLVRGLVACQPGWWQGDASDCQSRCFSGAPPVPLLVPLSSQLSHWLRGFWQTCMDLCRKQFSIALSSYIASLSTAWHRSGVPLAHSFPRLWPSSTAFHITGFLLSQVSWFPAVFWTCTELLVSL